MKRTPQQYEANSIDLELFNLSRRAERFTEDKTLSHFDRSTWLRLMQRIDGARHASRMLMSKEDVAETQS